MVFCLTAVQSNKGDPEYDQQKSDVSHCFSYKVQTYRNVGRISLTFEKIGNDTNPKYKLQSNVLSLDSGYSKDDITYLFYRKIEGIAPDYKGIHRDDKTIITDEHFANKPEIKN